MVCIALCRAAQIIHRGGLLNQHVLESTCVLIQDARSFDTEVTNDLGGYVADLTARSSGP
jgi:hypothetical protein